MSANTKVNHQLKLSVGGYSSAGIKASNEDAFAVSNLAKTNCYKGVVATIADGVSSASHAAQAAQLSVSHTIEEFLATPDTWSTKKAMAKVLTSLNQWLYSQGASQFNDDQTWLTTLTSCVFKGCRAYVFHVGDARLSCIRDSQLEVVTRDHQRHKTVLTRALGADLRLDVDVHELTLQTDDIYVFTTDGAHGFISTQAIIDAFQETDNLERSCQQLVQLAIDNGSDDNLTVLAVKIDRVPELELDQLYQSLTRKVIPPVLDVGAKIDDYQVLKIIHASTRSHLYLVQRPDEVPCVLKAPSDYFSDDPLYLQGFIREAWIGQRLNHPNIMRLKLAPLTSPFLYHLCELIDGQTLADWMRQSPTPSVNLVSDILLQCMQALRTFQRMDIVHRDLKPENIMIDRHGQIKLIDYGAASVASLDEQVEQLQADYPLGSVNYIAPETLLTLQSDSRSDLFSLAVVGYQLLTGQLPYPTIKRAHAFPRAYHQWRYRRLKSWRSDVPVWLDLVFERALAADPQKRLQAYSEFEYALTHPDVSDTSVSQQIPLLQRDPVRFWQWLSLLQFILLLLLLLY